MDAVEFCEDLSYSDLDTFPEFLMDRRDDLEDLNLEHNSIAVLPRYIGAFQNLVELNVSNNRMSYLSPEIIHLSKLKKLICKNNAFDNESIPKDFGLMQSLETMNFSGNYITEFPMQFTELTQLKSIFLGGNNIRDIPSDIKNLTR